MFPIRKPDFMLTFHTLDLCFPEIHSAAMFFKVVPINYHKGRYHRRSGEVLPMLAWISCNSFQEKSAMMNATSA